MAGSQKDTADVLNYGMGYNLQRFSPLTQINNADGQASVPVWNYSYDDNRSEESQPLVYKGVLYVTTNAATMAIDAKTGKQIWKTKVEYPPEMPRIVCCGIISRGVAIYDGKVFRTTLDANVIALDAKTGKELWRSNVIDFKDGYSHDGGAAGRRWRGHHRHLRRRVRHPRLHRRLGSADRQASVAHLHHPRARRARRRDLAGRHLEAWRRLDLDHRLVRSGAAHRSTGASAMPGPWNADGAPGRQPLHLLGAGARSQDREDQVALPVLAERSVSTTTASRKWCWPTLNINGKPTKVVMDANRNGFFYVLDRTNGKLIAANPVREDQLGERAST